MHTNALRKSNLLWRTFLIYSLCIFLPTVILLETLYFSRIQKQEQDYVAAYTDKALHVTQMLEEQFSVINATSTDFYLSSWYKKYISKSEVFQSEFDIVRRINIVEDLACRVALLPLVEDILIINSQTRSIICKYGWFSSVDKYSASYVPLNLSALADNLKSSDLFVPIKTTSDAYQVISYPDFNLGSSSRIAVLMKNEAILDYLKSIEFNTFTDISICWNHSGEKDVPADGSCTTSTVSPKLYVHFRYPVFRQVFAEEMTFYCVSLFFLCAVVSLLLSGFFCYLFSHPLQKLIASLPLAERSTHRDAYRNISEHIESINRKNSLMEKENSRIRSEALSMLDTMRADLMLRAMKGDPVHPDFGYFDQLFPMLHSRRPYFLIILQRPNSPLEEAVRDHFLYLNIFEGYCGYMIWPETPEHARGSILALLAGEDMIGCSQEYCGIENLTACYRDALEQTSYWQAPVTLSDSISLLDSVRHADASACLQILGRYRQLPNSSMACKWMFNLLQTYFFEGSADRFSCCWESVEEMIRISCASTAKVSGKRESSSVIVATMSGMIHEHYEIPDLSLKYFSSQFDISVSSLSRLFSQTTGENFSTVLQNVRISKAKEMLQQSSGMNIANIAVACGYENYLSFKRAFTRCEGISPREYRDIHK